MKNAPYGIELYLLPTYFIDCDHPDIIRFVKNTIGKEIDKKKIAQRLYLAVRDGWKYNPYNINLQHKELKASALFNRENKSGYCIEKACLLAACLRAANIPARLCFFDVKNHIGVERFIDLIKTDVLAFHACTDVYLDEKWVKATPAFNKELCDKLCVDVLEFDGEEDSVFQQFDKNGSVFMEYVKEYGSFHDVPHDMFVMLMKQYYPHFFSNQKQDKIMYDI